MFREIQSFLASPYFLLTCANILWSGNFIVSRAMRGEVPPVSLNFWRWMVALLILLPLGLGQLRLHFGLVRRYWKVYLGLGATGVALFHIFVYTALTTTPAINALLFDAIIPGAIATASWIAYRDTITMRQGLGILFSLLGALVVIARGSVETLLTLHLNPGDLWMLAAFLVWAVYSILLKGRPAAIPQLAPLTATVIAGVGLLLLVYLWQVWRGEKMVITEPNPLGVLYVAVFSSVIAFSFWNNCIAEIGATTAGMFSNLMPVFGGALAVMILGEPIASYQFLSALLFFGGIAFSHQVFASRRAFTPACTLDASRLLASGLICPISAQLSNQL